MSPNPSTANWIRAGAIRIPYLEKDASGKIINYAIVNAGFENCSCEKGIFMDLYFDWLSEENRCVDMA